MGNHQTGQAEAEATNPQTARGQRQSDGAYYTTAPGAALVAELAIGCTRPLRDGVRVVDPACGDGALLEACARTLHARRAGRVPSGDSITGYDIDETAVAAARTAVQAAAPGLRTTWRTFPHGATGKGHEAGALELLAGQEGPLFADPERGAYDVVVMNPPFTRNEVRGTKFERPTLTAMRSREAGLRDLLRGSDPASADAVNPNSIQTFFVVLADYLLEATGGRLVLIVPTTALVSAGVLAQRRLLARRFVIEHVVTSHDHGHQAFSRDSKVFESIIACRRRRRGEHPEPTVFTALGRMPRSTKTAVETARWIGSGRHHPYTSATSWPATIMEEGDWTPCQWYDPRLAEVARQLETHPGLEPLRRRARLGPKEGNVRHSWVRVAEAPPGDSRARRVVGHVSGQTQRSIETETDQWVVPGRGRAHLWQLFDERSSKVLVAERYDVFRTVLTAILLEQPSFGIGWRPVIVESDERAAELALWWNTTAARILLLSRRGKLLTYPKWSTEHLLTMPVPDAHHNPSDKAVAKTLARLKGRQLRPINARRHDTTARELDRLFLESLGTSARETAEWRELLAAEPTLTRREEVDRKT